MSEAKSGVNHPLFGKTPSIKTKALISAALGGGTIFVYDSDGILVNTFCSTSPGPAHLAAGPGFRSCCIFQLFTRFNCKLYKKW